MPAAAFDELDRLMQAVPSHRAGAGVFDLFLAAQMRAHRIATLCTYNTADFASLVGITASTPEDLRVSLALDPPAARARRPPAE